MSNSIAVSGRVAITGPGPALERIENAINHELRHRYPNASHDISVRRSPLLLVISSQTYDDIVGQNAVILDPGGRFQPIAPPPTVPPIPVRIHCPECHALHVDEGEWATKPHHTHSCQECGHTWRPAVVHTVGVRFLPGFRNTENTPA